MKYIDENGLAHLWLLLKEKLNGKVTKELKTGSTTEYKVLSDNNLTDELKTKINNAGTSNFSGKYNDLTGIPTLDGTQLKGALTKAGLGIAKASDVTAIQNAGYQTASQVNTAITGKGYQTAAQVKTAIEAYEYQTADDVDTIVDGKGYQTASDVESAITAKGYQTASQVNTTITGKGYQTAAQVNTAITSKGYATETYVNNKVASINKKQVVTSTTAMTDANTIYLMANSGTGNNIYDEYIVVDGKPEKIGTTEVNLTNYLKKTDMVAITNAEIDAIIV